MTGLTTQEKFEERIRTRVRTARDGLAKSAPPPWRPPEITDFMPYHWVLAFDATLTNCGWAWFMVTPEGLLVGAKGTIRPRTDKTGYLGTWDKARICALTTTTLIDRYPRRVPLASLVVEAPSVAGGSRTESSLIAGMLVWREDPEGCAVVSATHVSAVLLGDPRCKSAERKKRIREAVIRLCPEAKGRGWNEHERDALATGLVHLHDKEARHEQ